MVKLTIRQMAQIKRVAQNINPLVTKKNKALLKINALQEEIQLLDREIEGHEMGVKFFTEGYSTEQLIKKVVEDTGKVNKDGSPIKVTKYEPNEEYVVFDESTNTYSIRETVFTLEEDNSSLNID